jgi:hypothetical protein
MALRRSVRATSRPSSTTCRSRVADALVSYERRHGLDDAALADWLGIDIHNLLELAVYRRPDPLAAEFPREVRRMAAATGCDVIRLVLLLTDPGPAEENAAPSRPA